MIRTPHPLTPTLSQQACLGELATQCDRIRKRMRWEKRRYASSARSLSHAGEGWGEGRVPVVKASQDYVCQSCGAVSAKWQGKCPSCGAWNSLAQEGSAPALPARPGSRPSARPRPPPSKASPPRTRRCGASFRASANSTARRATALRKARPCCSAASRASASPRFCCRRRRRSPTQGYSALYFSGEEATGQIRMRAARLGLSQAPLGLAAETCVERILATVEQAGCARFHRGRFDPDALDRNHRDRRPEQ